MKKARFFQQWLNGQRIVERKSIRMKHRKVFVRLLLLKQLLDQKLHRRHREVIR